MWFILTSIVLISTILPLAARANFCGHYVPPKQYEDIKIKAEESIKSFSNIKAIASLADQTLSKLIAVKSPVIVSWISKRNLGAKSSDEIMPEWRVYYAKNFILTKYPHNDDLVDKEIEKLMNLVNKFFSSKAFRTSSKVPTFSKSEISLKLNRSHQLMWVSS